MCFDLLEARLSSWSYSALVSRAAPSRCTGQLLEACFVGELVTSQEWYSDHCLSGLPEGLSFLKFWWGACKMAGGQGTGLGWCLGSVKSGKAPMLSVVAVLSLLSTDLELTSSSCVVNDGVSVSVV